MASAKAKRKERQEARQGRVAPRELSNLFWLRVHFVGQGTCENNSRKEKSREQNQLWDRLWQEYGACKKCNHTFAQYARVLWDGQRDGLVHEQCVDNDRALPWSMVCLDVRGYAGRTVEEIELAKKESLRRETQEELERARA